MSLAVPMKLIGTETVSSDESPTPQGLNMFGAELVGRIFDPFGVGNSIGRWVPIRGFHPRLMILFPFGELRGTHECQFECTFALVVREASQQFLFGGGWPLA